MRRHMLVKAMVTFPSLYLLHETEHFRPGL